jgi:hypothetical protein
VIRINLPRHVLKDRVSVLARDGFAADGEFHGREERVIARYVRCLIVTRDAGRLPPELVRMVARGTAQVMLGMEPVLRDGYVLRTETPVKTAGRRYVVRSPQPFPSAHNPVYQVAQLEDDPVGEVRPT